MGRAAQVSAAIPIGSVAMGIDATRRHPSYGCAALARSVDTRYRSTLTVDVKSDVHPTCGCS